MKQHPDRQPRRAKSVNGGDHNNRKTNYQLERKRIQDSLILDSSLPIANCPLTIADCRFGYQGGEFAGWEGGQAVVNNFASEKEAVTGGNLQVGKFAGREGGIRHSQGKVSSTRPR